MEKHTPGPWKYVREDDYWSIEPTAIGGKDDMEGNEADYRLIAAAPDLLAVLQKLHWGSLDKDNMEFRCETTCFVRDEIRAAIAKATGG